MLQQLTIIQTSSHGWYEAIAREFVTRDLHKQISMNTFLRDVMRFTADAQGNLIRNGKWTCVVESPSIAQHFQRIAFEMFSGIEGLVFIDVGFHSYVGDTLNFHVYSAYFDERNTKWS